MGGSGRTKLAIRVERAAREEAGCSGVLAGGLATVTTLVVAWQVALIAVLLLTDGVRMAATNHCEVPRATSGEGRRR